MKVLTGSETNPGGAEILDDWASYLQSNKARTEQIFSFSSEKSRSREGRDWITFNDIKHCGGLHRICIRYSPGARAPLRLMINGVIQPLFTSTTTAGQVAADLQQTSSVDSEEKSSMNYQATAFREMHLIDLGSSFQNASVAFQPVRGSDGVGPLLLPNVVSFFFEKVLADAFNDVEKQEQATMHDLNGDDDVDGSYVNPFVFHFDVGSVGRNSDERFADSASFALRGMKPITFRSGECNDAMTIGSTRIGSRGGGSTLPAITFVGDDDRINEMRLGMSYYAGDLVGANFCAAIEHMSFENTKTGQIKNVEGLSAYLRTKDTTVWNYNRNKLGLDIWLTSAYHMKGLNGSKSSQIFQHGFALSKSRDVPFSIDAFEEFWQWFVNVKYYSVNYDIVGKQGVPLEKVNPEDLPYDFPTELISIEERMRPLHDFLLSCFSGKNKLAPDTGFLRGTKTHLTLTHDEFNIYVKLVPDRNSNEKIVSALFIAGTQYDQEGKTFENLGDNPQEVTAYALCSTLQDLEVLFEMGLLYSHNLVMAEERELLSPTKGHAYRLGEYEQTKEAKRTFHFLVMVGLRKVAVEEVMVEGKLWDIYDIAAAQDGYLNIPSITAIFCMIIQVVAPICLALRAFYTDEGKDLNIIVYIARLFFGVYAVLYELKLQNESGEKERLSLFLSMLPEFNSRRLLFGLFVNVMSKIALSIGIIVLLCYSYTVIDVTLNALALYFILDVDDYLVSSTSLSGHRKNQEDALFRMKYVASRSYYEEDAEESELWTFTNWGAYSGLVKAMHRASLIAVSVGVIWIATMPFALGQPVNLLM